jgi:ubiquinone/menaquinone biosynthesis C-methylase UbiE
MWASGDYPSMVETFLLPLGPKLVDACGITSGMRVLDVAAGTGNASIPAAKTGADVTASDLTPELFDAGRRRAEAEGVTLEWVEADAEHLPFEEESYDVVISSIGAMFAPHHQEVADELIRVCRPGGTIAAQTNARNNGREDEFDAAVDAFCDEWNRGTPDEARFEQEYLLAVGTRA